MAAITLAGNERGSNHRIVNLTSHSISGRAGRESEARAKLNELESESREHYVPPYFFALIHAGLDETERTLDRLEEAWSTRDAMLRDLLVDAAWDQIRGEPRFKALMAKMNYA